MKSKDRLAELKNAIKDEVYNKTVEVIMEGEKNSLHEDIRDIFDEIEKIRNWITEINRNTLCMRKLHMDPTFHTNKNLQDQLESLITTSNGVALKACGGLRQFERRVHSSRCDVRVRIARLQYATARQLYAEALTTHQLMLQLIRNGQYDLLQEQIRLTNLSISEDECQSLLESKNLSLFVDNIEADTAEARLALQDVEARHSELLKIEESIREVRDLFVQMQQLVAEQQDQIDTVEFYAQQATDQVEYGGQALMKGTVSRRKARRKKISLIVCLVSGFLLVLFVLLAT